MAGAGQPDAPAQSQLAVDAREVRLDGLDADEEGGSDLGIGVPGGHELDYALLGGGERVVPPGRETLPLRLGEFLPARGAEARERGDGLVKRGSGIAALPGLPLRRTQD